MTRVLCGNAAVLGDGLNTQTSSIYPERMLEVSGLRYRGDFRTTQTALLLLATQSLRVQPPLKRYIGDF
jgi:hypothetical protein